MNRAIQSLIATSLALGALAAQPPGPASACASAPAPFDSFTAAAPAARTIVIGTAEGLSSQRIHNKFRLRVDEVLRGRAPAAMRFSGLSGGDARSACGDRSQVVVRDGDRLALAMGPAGVGRVPDVEAVAFVGKKRPHHRNMPGVERLPISRIRELAGRSGHSASIGRRYDAGPAADGLFTERVAPGIARVRGLGVAHDLRSIRHLDVGPRDRVWAAAPDRAFKLAARREYPVDGPTRLSDIEAIGDGEALAVADGIWRFNGGAVWYLVGSADDDALHSPHEAADGSVWALSEAGPAVLEAYEWTYSDWNDVGVPAGCMSAVDGHLACVPTGLVDSPDGSLWLGFGMLDPDGLDPDGPIGGIRRYDGTSWAVVAGPVDGPFAVEQLSSRPDGPVWALISIADEADASRNRRLAHWDGEVWTVHELPAGMGHDAQLVAAPDDSVWLSRPPARFDGEAWTGYVVPGRAGSGRSRVSDLSIAPDGSAWMVVRRLAASGASRPDGIYILDPSRARPEETAAR